MSKRRKKVEQLLLHNANWMPVAEPHRLLTGLVGDGNLAAKDLTAAVAAKRCDKRLPCMQRAIPSHIAPDQDREIVPLSFWDKYEFGFDPVNGLKVCRKNRFPAYPVEFPIPVAFFVWKPKFEKIWPALAASAAPHAASSAREDEPTPATTARIDDKPQRRRPGPKIKQNWRLFVAAQVYEIKKREGRTPSAGELAQLCEDEIYYQPDESDIQKFLRILLNE
jgi:hypothetical protein